MSERHRSRFLLGWLRNLLVLAAALSLWQGITTAVDLRLQNEEVLPTPPAFDDPSAQPAFAEEATSPMPYAECLSCHWDIFQRGGMTSAGQDDDSLPAQVARIMAAGQHEAELAGTSADEGPRPKGEPTPAPTLPTAEPGRAPSPTPPAGVPVRLAIPSLELNSAVVAVAATTQNGRAIWEVPLDVVGWFRASAMPGGQGNTVMSGHVAQREGLGVFRDLYRVRLGDRIAVDTDAAAVSYTVREIRIVLPSDTQYLQPTKDERLTIITCTGRYDTATRTFSHRLIVIAKPE